MNESIKNKKSNRNLYLDYIKGMLIALVILGHIMQFAYMYSDNYDGFWSDYLWKFIYTFHMPLFVGISGYFTYLSLERNKIIWSFLYSRVIYLLIPLIAWCILESFIFLYFSEGTTIAAYIKWIVIRVVMSHWFIWTILIASTITAIIYQTKQQLLLLIISLILVISIPSSFHYFNFYLFKTVYVYFIVGFLFAQKNLIRYFDSRKLIILSTALIISILGYYFWNKETYIYITPAIWSNVDIMIFRFITSISISIIVLFISYKVYTKSSCNKITQTIEGFGQESLSLYLMQNAFFLILEYHIVNFYTKWTFLFIVPAFILSILFLFATKLIAKNKILALLLLGKKSKF